MLEQVPRDTPLFFFDETSIHTWCVRAKTWSAEAQRVILPKQAKRSKNKTILGAVGGIADDIRFIYSIDDRTNTSSVIDFFKHFLRKVKYRKQILVITDNHSAHHSKLLKLFMMQKEKRIKLIFLPAYSSVLSPQERVWSQLKSLWSKNMSRISKAYDLDKFEDDIELICA